MTTRKTKNTRKTRKTNKTNDTRKTKKTLSYIVAIPSYDRPEAIVQKSLKTLLDGGVPNNLVHIFVANAAEEKRYKSFVPKELYGKIVVGKIGITEQRKYIIEYYPENQPIVSIDDDVEGLFKKVSDKELKKVTNIHKFFTDAFQTLKKENLYIWGIYPVHNPFFMKNKTTTDLKFIIGTLYGFINRKTNDVQPSSKIKEKEDYEQSIKYFMKDGGVVRFNDVTIKAKKHAPGGLGVTEGRLEANRVAAEYLEKTYPGYVSVFNRDNGMCEVRMARIKRDGTPK
jgi:hypothetical protein